MEDKEIMRLAIAAMVIVIIWLYVRLKTLTTEKEKLQRKNARLEADNAMLEADHLKFQLHPHTLNNVLYNLQIIAGKLNDGMQSFTGVMEYIIYKGGRHMVSVEDEIEFISKYLELNKVFLNEIDSIKICADKVDKSCKHYSSPCIPHLITAYFLENAFKHGDKDHEQFLKVDVELTNGYFTLSVINRIPASVFEKKHTVNGGIGLNNMRKRLEILHAGHYEIATEAKEREFHSVLKLQL